MLEQFGIRPIINAVGYATRVSGSCPHPEVIAAMSAASAQYFEIDDLLTAASTLIARCTGAEAGVVTCGAGAALTLAAAACLKPAKGAQGRSPLQPGSLGTPIAAWSPRIRSRLGGSRLARDGYGTGPDHRARPV